MNHFLRITFFTLLLVCMCVFAKPTIISDAKTGGYGRGVSAKGDIANDIEGHIGGGYIMAAAGPGDFAKPIHYKHDVVTTKGYARDAEGTKGHIGGGGGYIYAAAEPGVFAKPIHYKHDVTTRGYARDVTEKEHIGANMFAAAAKPGVFDKPIYERVVELITTNGYANGVSAKGDFGSDIIAAGKVVNDYKIRAMKYPLNSGILIRRPIEAVNGNAKKPCANRIHLSNNGADKRVRLVLDHYRTVVPKGVLNAHVPIPTMLLKRGDVLCIYDPKTITSLYKIVHTNIQPSTIMSSASPIATVAAPVQNETTANITKETDTGATLEETSHNARVALVILAFALLTWLINGTPRKIRKIKANIKKYIPFKKSRSLSADQLSVLMSTIQEAEWSR